MNTSEDDNATRLGGDASEILQTFQLYYIPILSCLGILGNSLSVFVFFKTKLKKLSSSYYLSCLAISDSCFLALLFIIWLTSTGYDIYNITIMCEAITYLSGVTSFLSVWLVLAFTVERFLAVVYPLHRQTVCRISHTKRAKTVIMILILISMVIYAPMLLFVGIEQVQGKPNCVLVPEWQEEANIFNYVDTVLTYVIPVLGIAVLNGFISKNMWDMAKIRRRLTHQNSAGRDGLSLKYKRKSPSLSQYKITKMLLVVSTTCLCLSLPSYVMRILAFLLETNVITMKLSTFVNAQQYVLMLFYANFGIDFILYCISGQNFRKAVRGLFCPKRFRRRNTSALTDSRTQSTGSSVVSKKRRTLTTDHQEASSTQMIAMKVF